MWDTESIYSTSTYYFKHRELRIFSLPMAKAYPIRNYKGRVYIESSDKRTGLAPIDTSSKHEIMEVPSDSDKKAKLVAIFKKRNEQWRVNQTR